MNNVSNPVATPIDLSVRSLIIPLNGLSLLLPNTAVAEVSDYKVPQPLTDAPAWLLGMMLWRGRSVPLLAFEPLLGRPAGIGGAHARAAICNTLNANPVLPFVAILSQGIPRLQELKSDMFDTIDIGAKSPAVVAARFLLGGREAIIPNLDALERQLLQFGVKVG